jgi:DNA-binding NtrC family response regulator
MIGGFRAMVRYCWEVSSELLAPSRENYEKIMSNARPCVILIEDHPLIRVGQRMLLEHAGYRVSEIAAATDLDSFVVTPGERQVIIADFDLGPGMNGVEVAKEIMRRAGETIPTLVLSASFGNRSLAAAKVGGMPLMFKPATEQQILTWVADALSGLSQNSDDPNPSTP